MTTLADLEQQTQAYAQARTELKNKVAELQAYIDRAKADALPAIRKAAEQCASLQAELDESVASNMYLFEKPRTHTWHGIKVGTRKLPGKLLCNDEFRAVALIEKNYPDEVATTIKVTKKLVKNGFINWTAQMLKRCGITIEADSDAVVIKPMDDDIDKLVDSLLDDNHDK